MLEYYIMKDAYLEALDMFGDLIKSVFTPTGASWGLGIITALALIKQIHTGHI